MASLIPHLMFSQPTKLSAKTLGPEMAIVNVPVIAVIVREAVVVAMAVALDAFVLIVLVEWVGEWVNVRISLE